MSKALRLAFYLVLVCAACAACSKQKNGTEAKTEAEPVVDAEMAMGGIPADAPWSVRMALSDMQRNPEAWQIDFRDQPKWEYTHGLMLLALSRLYKETKDPVYLDYIKGFGDMFIDNRGGILTYDLSLYNIDRVAPGRALFFLLDQTGDKKYRTAIDTLHRQLQEQPRTSEGGFWHKKRYPWQMWLDGLYMGSPFYAEYLHRYNNSNEAFNDVKLQFDLIMKNNKDRETGLLYHGWDESREQRWADPETGQSPHFWSRAMGWYVMAMVDVIEFFPEEHTGRELINLYLLDTLQAIKKYQDQETGLWYQVLDQGGREGNYLEATGSSMFVYAMAKGVNRGYLPASYLDVARKGYDGIIKHLIKVDADDNEVHLTQNCSVAGLGGDPYRDGSYEYYISEPVRDNDPKGVGPFIMASLELDR